MREACGPGQGGYTWVSTNLRPAHENIRHLTDTVGSEIWCARCQTLRAPLVSIHVFFAHRSHGGLVGCRPAVCSRMEADFPRLHCLRTHRSCLVAPDKDAPGVLRWHRAIGNPRKASRREHDMNRFAQ